MRQNANNEFKDGLNLDLHPIVTPNTILTDNINGTFITYNGNEFCLQNDRGNKKIVSDIDNETVSYVHLTNGYTPIGIKERNGVLYIVSVNGNKTEIGTFPAPRYPSSWDNTLYDEEYKGSFKDENGFVIYDALHVLEEHSALTNVDLGYTTETPVTIEIQDSYDGSVNLILIADGCKPRIINSGFSVLPNNQYKFVNRAQDVLTNIYSDSEIGKESELIRTSGVLTNIGLLGVQSGGQWKGGNYTFYIKFGDGDFNQTDIVGESGIVSIFNGNDAVPSTISGTLLDERTDKMINLKITGLNLIYSKIYIYFTREYSDTQGYRMTECGMLSEPIDLKDMRTAEEKQQNVDPYQTVWLTGFEQQTPVDIEELNVDYHTIDWARAEAQHSNMLFLGNVGQEETFKLYQQLKEFTKGFTVTIKQDLGEEQGISKVTSDYKSGTEYYSTANIYSKLGYWPDEIYRFGIVYVLKDGSTTPVFNVTGGVFTSVNSEITTQSAYTQYINDLGVFRTPRADIITSSNKVRPLYFNFELPSDVSLLESNNVAGWFVVRQKRIPRTICQGLTIGIDEKSNLPMIWNGNDWMIESFLSLDRTDKDRQQELIKQIEDLEGEYKNTWWKVALGLLVAPVAGIFITPGMFTVAVSYGVTTTVNSKLKLEALKRNISESKKPMLYYLADSLKEFELTSFGVCERRDSNAPAGTYYTHMYANYNEWYSAYIEDPKYQAGEVALVDNVDKVGQNDAVFFWDYLLIEPENMTLPVGNSPLEHATHIYFISNDPEYITDLIVERHGENRRIPLFTEPSEISDILGEFYRMPADMRKAFETENALIRSFAKYCNRYIYESTADLKGRGLLSLDPCVNSSISGMLDGSIFEIVDEYNVNCAFGVQESETDLYYNDNYLKVDHENYIYTGSDPTKKARKCVYVAPNTNIKVIDNYEFSNIAGNAAEVNRFKHTTESYYKDLHYGVPIYNIKSENENNDLNIVRGKFTPYVGIAANDIAEGKIYSIRLDESNTNLSNLFLVRKQDSSEYYCVSERNPIRNGENEIYNSDVYRGDCYTNTITMRILNNFVDSTAPVSDQILDEEGWYKVLQAIENPTTNSNNEPIDPWSNVNLSDVNTVDLGYWVTFKCLSSYNLGLRCMDNFHTDKISMFGSPRSFYPLNSMSTATGNKIEESLLLNDGLSATVGRKRYNLMPDVPYSRSEFSNRIMFSNVHVTDAYTNGYRTFQGLSYKDYDKQYGAITKLISLGQNIFIVMEHGLGLVAVNPKALMQTTTGEMIHIYGYGVLPDEITVISQDYGSKYEHSVLRTPIGIYGIDVDANKVWRYSDRNGFETISDMKIETYLKDNLQPLSVDMGTSDIRTHYNAKKGDVMFTWYSGQRLYSICFNERQNLWVTKYDWCPIVSENVDDEFYSLNKKQDDSNDNLYYIWDHKYDVAFNGGHVSSWYDNENGFEFEFVVSNPIGIGKIFDNLQIISNNVQPDEMEISIMGDDYEFKRDNTPLTAIHKERAEYNNITDIKTTSNTHDNNTYRSDDWTYKYDLRLNQKMLVKSQIFKDIYRYGRRIGNIQYKNGMWFAQIEPLRMDIAGAQQKKEVRIRDKWAKIRIRYSGKDLAIIAAIKTLINV